MAKPAIGEGGGGESGGGGGGEQGGQQGKGQVKINQVSCDYQRLNRDCGGLVRDQARWSC